MYLIQLIKVTPAMQLLTEVSDDTFTGLQKKAAAMVKKYPETIGKTYRIFEIVKTGDKFNSKLLKEGVIKGISK